MKSSKLALAVLFTTMLVLLFCIRSFVADELTVIENSVQAVQEENVKQLSKVVEEQEQVNKVPWLVSRLIFSAGVDKRKYIQAQITRQIESVETNYINGFNYRDDEKVLQEYVVKNWAGYKESLFKLVNFIENDNLYAAKDQMEDSLLYLERVNDGMRMIVAFHERDVAEKTHAVLNTAVEAERNVLILAVMATMTVIVVGLVAWRIVTSTEDKLRRQAYHDALTGLPNRLSFQKLVNNELQNGGHSLSGAVVFLDMDNFKQVNDHYGHDAGDKFLIVIASRIRSFFNENVWGARLGGDEFVLFLRNITRQNAELFLKELLRLIAKPVQLAGTSVSPTPSIGVAFYPHHGSSAAELLKNADIAMYQAKEKKNSYVIYDAAFLEDSTSRQQLEQNLRQAIARNELSLVYQAILCMRSHKIIGFEALLRWKSEQCGDVSPAEFIPVAEATGLIVPIGQWVLAQAAALLRQLADAGRADVFISVNVSVIQLMQEDFIALVAATVKDYNISRGRLKIEITESVLIESFVQIAAKLEKIRSMGIQICLDDFGAGYSSLHYLTRLPLDILKLDRALIGRLDSDERAPVVLENLIRLAHGIGIQVVAEGIELESQLALIQQLGCDCAQGYLLGKPETPGDLFEHSGDSGVPGSRRII